MRGNSLLLVVMTLVVFAMAIHAAIGKESRIAGCAGGEVVVLPTTDSERRTLAVVDFDNKTVSIVRVRVYNDSASMEVRSVAPYLVKGRGTAY